MHFSFEENLDRYAELIIKIGLNLQLGQRLMIADASRNNGVPIQVAPLVRKIVKKAYEAGSPFVDVIWADEQLKLLRFQNAPQESFDIFPQWLADGMLAAASRGDALLNLSGFDPDLLKGQDPERIGKWQKTVLEALEPASAYTRRNATNWCLVGAPVASWAVRVYPHLPEEEALQKLWSDIFKLVRLDQPDPISAWQTHISDLAKRCDYFQNKQYVAFKYRAPGTDLTVGLPAGHLWKGGSITAQNGVPFVPNLPTEEVFTLADRGIVDGVVQATKPLAYSGQIVEDFSFRFENGKVTWFSAKKGETVLRKLFETDEGASRLGEVALVPHSSPVSKSGTMFHHTLFDENAACHLALGAAYNFTMQGAENMSNEEFASAGGNHSVAHVDFMIGCTEMDIDGVTADQQLEPVMRSGEWAFKV
jgi:aminopeptidase